MHAVAKAAPFGTRPKSAIRPMRVLIFLAPFAIEVVPMRLAQRLSRHIKQEHPVFPFFLTAQLFQCTLVAKSLAVVADDAAQPINKRIEPVERLQQMQQEIHQYIMMLQM
mgnify:CR=1 FL=1